MAERTKLVPRELCERLVQELRELLQVAESYAHGSGSPLDEAIVLAEEALIDAELELGRPAKPRRSDVENTIAVLDEMVFRGEVRHG